MWKAQNHSEMSHVERTNWPRLFLCHLRFAHGKNTFKRSITILARASIHFPLQAIHQALGLQFLGAGRLTLSRSPEAIAALLCAFFPKFPIHSNDNRYHLQALRHLYVLAVEPRILLPRDIDSGKLCLCNVTYTTLDGTTFSKMAPCMLPELNELAEVRFEDANYWLIKFERGNNWEDLE